MSPQQESRKIIEILSSIYREPEIQKRKLPAPDPYEVELEETIVESYEQEAEISVWARVRKTWTLVAVNGYILFLLSLAILHKSFQHSSDSFFVDSGKAFTIFFLVALFGSALVGILFFKLFHRDYATLTQKKLKPASRPCPRTIKVEVGQQDYPLKRVVVSTATQQVHSEQEDADRGPSQLHLIVGSIGLGLGAVIFVLILIRGLHQPLVGWQSLLPWLGGVLALAGFAAMAILRETDRKIEKETYQVVGWEASPKEVMIEVDSKYAPVYEDYVVPNPTRVVALGCCDFKFAAMEIGGDLYLADWDKVLPPQRVELSHLPEGDQVGKLMAELDELAKNIPAILNSQLTKSHPTNLVTSFGDKIELRGEEARLMELFEGMEQVYAHIQTEAVDLCLIPPATLSPKNLERCGGLAEESPRDDTLSRLGQLLETIEKQDLIEAGVRFAMDWGRNNEVLSGARFQSLAQDIAPALMKSGNISHYSSFNFYCPECNADRIARLQNRNYWVSKSKRTPPIEFSSASRCVYEIEHERWRCPACEQVIEKPIPIHKMLDEVFYPAYDRLVAENELERFKLDNATRDDELNYQNEMAKELGGIKNELELEIGRLGHDISSVGASAEGHRKAITSLLQIAEGYRLKQQQALVRIEQSSQELARNIKANIEEEQHKLKEGTAALIKEYERFMTERSQSKRKEDEVRDAIQVGILTNTGFIAVNTERAVQHLERIDSHTERTADNTERAVHHLERIDSHTERSANSLEKIEVHTKKTAQATTQSAKSLGKIEVSSRAAAEGIVEGNAIQAAMAKKQGLDPYQYAWYRLDKNLPKLGSELMSAATGRSAMAKYKKIGRVSK